jgi:nicotinamide-nucleotide amidase
MALSIAVLTIGDELLNGEMADSNTATIARVLAPHGLRLRESLTVADVEDEIEEALLQLSARRDVVIVTGGLGPTVDDLTARVAARAFKRHLVVHDEALRLVREHFQRSGREMHPRNDKQALLPQKVTIIPNPLGSAPGFVLQHGGKELFFLPGVPKEMAAMLAASVLPRLVAGGGTQPLRERIFRILGLAEPAVEELVVGAVLPAGVEIAFGVDFPLVYLKLRSSRPEAEALLDRADLQVRRLLGEHLVAVGEETLAGNVARLLTGTGQTLALAESCTGGLIAATLTAIPGASAFLERGAVTYADSAKIAWLKIPAPLIEKEGAVSEACARAMARGIRRAAHSDFGLAVTGIAGPSGGTALKPVGTVFIALASEAGETVEAFCFGGDRDEVRQQTLCLALDLLRRSLIAQLADGGGNP